LTLRSGAVEVCGEAYLKALPIAQEVIHAVRRKEPCEGWHLPKKVIPAPRLSRPAPPRRHVPPITSELLDEPLGDGEQSLINQVAQGLASNFLIVYVIRLRKVVWCDRPGLAT